MAVSAFTVGKLFPARYVCETRLCSKLVHNACMTLCCLIFDVAVIFGMYLVKSVGLQRHISESKPGCLEACLGIRLAEVAKFLLTLSKSGGLAVSAAWVITDLLLVASAAPGQGTLILGSIATAASLLVLLGEFVSWIWLLPAAVKRLGKVMLSSEVMLTLLGNFDSDEQRVLGNNEYDHVRMLLILVSV